MTDFEKIELALYRAQERAMLAHAQDQSALLVFKLLIGEMAKIGKPDDKD